MKHFKSKCSLLFLCVLASLGGLAQRGGLSLGGITLLPAKSAPLKETMPLSRATRDLSYLERVGGIAFEKIAAPAEGLTVRTLTLKYNPNGEDGERLIITINGKKMMADIYDWELIPIAKYAQSEYFACVTLTGDILRLGSGGSGFNYHPELKNTLLGLRLWQLDNLILNSTWATDLPKLDGEYLLGEGESEPDLETNQEGYDNFICSRESLEELLGSHRGSYLICDLSRTVTFDFEESSFSMTGEPFYYFWKTGADDAGKLKAVYLDEYSEAINEDAELFRNINPAVWDAGVKTMQFSAFFRYCKKKFPREWQSFIESIRKVRILPFVETPNTVQLSSDEDSELED